MQIWDVFAWFSCYQARPGEQRSITVSQRLSSAAISRTFEHFHSRLNKNISFIIAIPAADSVFATVDLCFTNASEKQQLHLFKHLKSVKELTVLTDIKP